LNLVMTIISVIVIISLIVIAISAPYIYQKLD
jgi:hypothetical protein